MTHGPNTTIGLTVRDIHINVLKNKKAFKFVRMHI
jgi:hypothetical protein